MEEVNDTKKMMDARTMLADLDIRTDRYGHRRVFSVKLVTTTGKLYYLPQAYSCGCKGMDMKACRFRGVQPCDCKSNPEGHVIPVKITNIIEYNGHKIDWSNGDSI
jgi:hypothetical protein